MLHACVCACNLSVHAELKQKRVTENERLREIVPGLFVCGNRCIASAGEREEKEQAPLRKEEGKCMTAWAKKIGGVVLPRDCVGIVFPLSRGGMRSLSSV